MKQLLARWTGVVLALALAVPAWLFGRLVPIVGAPDFAILIGMALSFFKRPAFVEEGIRFSGKKVLQYSIVFLGFSLDLGVVVRVGGQSFSASAAGQPSPWSLLPFRVQRSKVRRAPRVTRLALFH